MKVIKSVLALFIVVFLLVGCADAARMTLDGAATAPRAVTESMAVDMEMEAPMEEAAMAFDEDLAMGESVLVAQNAAQERVIIRTADMSIVVTDTEEAMNTINQMVSDNGGWVVNSSVFQYADDAMTGNMSVRIPSDGFDSFLGAISNLAVEVTRISTSGQDVTEEYVDLSARLDNLEATADRVRNFLDEARTVEEALDVNRELSRLEGEIEAIKGRLQFLEQSADFSMISIDLTPDILAQPLEVGGWQPQGAARSAVETLVATLQTLVDVAIWFLIYILPIALIVGIPAWFVIRYFRKRRAARKATQPVPSEDN